ncbi:MAG: SDR family oxidoreductase [Bacteroidota bacterium]|nr:SDR family oxidoreductase [Bacteroidota bacterium]
MNPDSERPLRVWVTGASRGIGAACAREFADRGYIVAASGRDAAALAALERPASSTGSGCMILPFPCDVTDEESVKEAYRRILEYMSRVDVLVNNAGATVFKTFRDTTVQEFDTVVGTNVRGAFLCTQAVLPAMIERREGTIVMVVSVAARDVFRDSSVYAASKAAVKALADCLRFEVRDAGVRVVSVFPGATATSIWPPRVLEKHGHRMLRPEDVAKAVVDAVDTPRSVMVEEVVIQPIGGPLS